VSNTYNNQILDFMKTVITSIFLCCSSIIIAQSSLVTFEYDAAGNRVKRHANVYCEADKIHTEPFSITQALYQAAATIESNIRVEANDSLNYKAGTFILLEKGFEVFNAASFIADIEACEEDAE